MPGGDLFEDYDPDMEDIFGHKYTMTARRVTVTEQQKTDPLRKPKVELQGILVAEKQPITANDIERRMKDEYGQTLDPKKYGCNTLDDLLQACSDTIVHQRRRDGVHIYMAKISEANQDIVEMVQQQNTGHETKRAPRSFLTTTRNNGLGTHGASFRAYKGTRVSVVEESPKPKSTPNQFRARNKLGPAKTVARVQNLADLLDECREAIGTSHPDEPSRKIVTLGALAEKFKQVYGLPAWGKIMTESELHKQIDLPEFSGILSFWQFRDNGDMYVESNKQETINTTEERKEDTQVSPAQLEVAESSETTPTTPARETNPTPPVPEVASEPPALQKTQAQPIFLKPPAFETTPAPPALQTKQNPHILQKPLVRETNPALSALQNQIPLILQKPLVRETNPALSALQNQIPLILQKALVRETTPASPGIQKAQIPPILQKPLVRETTPTPEQKEVAAVAPSLKESTTPDPVCSVDDQHSFEDFSSIDSYSSDSSMLITETKGDDGFFESGPGFGGNSQVRQAQPASQTRPTRSGEITDLAQRFGNSTLQQPPSGPQSHAGSAFDAESTRSLRSASRNSREDAARSRSSSVRAMRPVHAAFGQRSIVYTDPLKILVEYVKSRVITSFETLPEDDKNLVNFNRNIFKCFSEKPGEIMVRLVNPLIDSSKLGGIKECLREPFEADFRWMTDANIHVKRSRRHFIKPVMFVAPRGFLVVVSNPDEEDLDADKMELMENLLRGAMEGAIQELTRKTVRPGMPAVYIYRQGAEIRYYRVLIVGRAHQNGDVMVLLADHNEQYLADVQFSHLFALPDNINFRNYAPNVIFATLYGVMSLSLKEQHNMWRNFDDEERKTFIVGYIPEDTNRVLSIDMVMRDENQQFEWLSVIAKRRGAIKATDVGSPHLGRNPANAIESFGMDCYMDFIDYKGVQSVDPPFIQHEDESDPEGAVVPAEETITDERDNALLASPSNPTFDLYKVFDKLIGEMQVVPIVSMYQFVRSINEADWQDLGDHMVEVSSRYKIRL